MTDGCNIKDRGDECLAAKGMVQRMVVTSRIAMTESLVAQGMAQCVVFIKIAVTEVWPLKDGAWNCNGAVTECLAAKGGTLCARVGSKRSRGVYICEEIAVGEIPWLLQGTN
jgi:hypothetical protein